MVLKIFVDCDVRHIHNVDTHIERETVAKLMLKTICESKYHFVDISLNQWFTFI